MVRWSPRWSTISDLMFATIKSEIPEIPEIPARSPEIPARDLAARGSRRGISREWTKGAGARWEEELAVLASGERPLGRGDHQPSHSAPTIRLPLTPGRFVCSRCRCAIEGPPVPPVVSSVRTTRRTTDVERRWLAGIIATWCWDWSAIFSCFGEELAR